MVVLSLWRNIYCSVVSFLNNHQLVYYLHQFAYGANGPSSSMPCTLLCFVSDLSSPFSLFIVQSSLIFNCLLPGRCLQRVRRWLGRSVRERRCLTGTSDMVTEMFLGCTVSRTHCCSSEAKRWGSSARSHRSLREQLQGDGSTTVRRRMPWGPAGLWAGTTANRPFGMEMMPR